MILFSVFHSNVVNSVHDSSVVSIQILVKHMLVGSSKLLVGCRASHLHSVPVSIDTLVMVEMVHDKTVPDHICWLFPKNQKDVYHGIFG